MVGCGAATAADDLRGPCAGLLEVGVWVGGVGVDPALSVVGMADVAVGDQGKVGAADGAQFGEGIGERVRGHAVDAESFGAEGQEEFGGMGEGFAGEDAAVFVADEADPCGQAGADGDLGGDHGFADGVHGFDEEQIDAGGDEVLDAFGVLGEAIVIGRDEIRAVAILEGGQRAGHLCRFTGVGDGLAGGGDGARGQFASRLVGAIEDAAVGAEGVGGDDVRARVQIVEMNLVQGVQAGVRGEGVGGPQGQAGVDAAAVEFGAGCAIKQEKVGVGVHVRRFL